MVDEPLHREQGAHTRVGTNRRTAIPEPSVRVAHTPTRSNRRQVEIESRQRGGVVYRPTLQRPKLANPDGGGVIEHPVDHRDGLHRAYVQEPEEGPEVPGRHGKTKTVGRLVVLANPVVERAARPAERIVVVTLDVERLGERDQQLG